MEGAAAIKAADFDPDEGTVTRADARCLACGQVTKAKDVRRLAREGKMGQRMVAVVLHHPRQTGKKYRLATAEDRRVFEGVAAYLEEKLAHWPYLESPIPTEVAPPEGHRSCSNAIYGMTTWDTFFNARQKLALVTFLEKIKGSYEQVWADCAAVRTRISRMDGSESVHPAHPLFSPDDLAQAVVGYLAIVLNRLADKNATLVVWHNIGEKVEHVFGRQSLAMTWDYIELNVFSGVNGDWTSNRDWILRYIRANPATNNATGFAQSASATVLPFPNNHFDAVLTDPPYYRAIAFIFKLV